MLTFKLASIVFLFLLTLNYGAGQRKSSLSLSERVQHLTEMAHKRPILKFNSNKFKEYVRVQPRNYSIIVMFTALAPQRQCAICHHANEEFTIVANSFRYSQVYSNKIFFVLVDFDEGSDIFQLYKLNTAPIFVHIPPKGKLKPQDNMDIQRVGFSAEAIAKWITERTDIQIRVFRPPNYSGTLALVVLFSMVLGFLYLRRNNLEFLYNKTMWATGSVFFCLTMISGQMWNHIRGPPFIHRGRDNEIAYIHSSSHSQFVLETYIVMVLNAAIVLGMILLTESGKKGDPRKRKMFAVTGLILVSVFFSLILSIFRLKTPGYPYSLLFK